MSHTYESYALLIMADQLPVKFFKKNPIYFCMVQIALTSMNALLESIIVMNSMANA